MIKILVISASPVAESSTEIILRQIEKTLIEKLQEKHEVSSSFFRLNELNYIPCQACGKAPKPEFCFYDDDLTKLYELLFECDCLLFGSPIYFDTVSAQAKSFIDRCNCFRPYDFDNTNPEHYFIKRVDKKRPAVMVLTGGEKGWFEGARRVIAGYFKWLEFTNEGKIIYHSPGISKGSARNDREILSEAEKLGVKLAGLIESKDD